MTWVRLDDRFAQHRKVVAAGPLAMAMQVAALGYCNRELTDGFIPRGIARTLIDCDPEQGVSVDVGWIIRRLLEKSLWIEVDGGYAIVEGMHQFGADAQDERRTPAYDAWRSEVLCRDGYACRHCGATDALHAHHIRPWAANPTQRFSVDNGLTLCATCHRAVHRKAAE